MGLDASKSLLQKVFTFFVFVQGQSNAMSDEIQMPAVLASSDTCHVDSSSSWKEQYDLLANVSPGGRAPPLLVQNSSIHGRGVYTPVLVEAGAKISFLWFDYEEHPGFEPESPNDSTTSSDSSSAAPGDDFLHKVGYIPAGGDLRVEDSIDVADTKRLCALNDACTAITFPNATGETIGSVQVNFKDKVDVSTTAASDWSSWLKPHSPKYKAVMYPWTCSGDIFPHLLPEDLPPVGMLTCATRLINHDCASSCDAIPEVSTRPFLFDHCKIKFVLSFVLFDLLCGHFVLCIVHWFGSTLYRGCLRTMKSQAFHIRAENRFDDFN